MDGRHGAPSGGRRSCRQVSRAGPPLVIRVSPIRLASMPDTPSEVQVDALDDVGQLDVFREKVEGEVGQARSFSAAERRRGHART